MEGELIGGFRKIHGPPIPPDSEIRACLRHVGFRRIRLDAGKSTLQLPEEGMRIGIAGIGKGYGIDRAAEVLESRGITSYIVDGGGDIRLRGRNLERPWRFGIAHPRETGSLFATVEPAVRAHPIIALRPGLVTRPSPAGR